LNSGRGRGLQSDVAIARSLGMDLGVPEVKVLRGAAVLVPLVDRPEGLHVLLTQRTDHLAHHAGQVSFPGGRLEDHDDGSVACALREAEEETGLPPGCVDVLGFLDDYVTVTGFRVVPVVGLVSPPFTLRPDPFEVAEVFEVPLDFLLDPANHQRVDRVIEGRSRPFYAMPYGRHYIWGATAGMLINLSRVLRD
jgi:8-oxo-dGTP pyrophosphatase MutT (NUDIX family)